MKSRVKEGSLRKGGARLVAFMLMFMMVFTMSPIAGMGNSFAAESDNRVADPSTMDSWQQYFGTSSSFDTENAGHVWTDKSVHTSADVFNYAEELADGKSKISMDTNDENNFLVSLSAMAASESITGQANKPTDTMIVLDMSSSMYKNSTRDPGPITAMIESVNSTIEQLQELNVNNRVGVTVYYGGPDLNQATKDSYQVWLPLDRYKHSSNKFLEAKVSGGKLDSVGVSSSVTTESGKSVKVITRATNVIAGTYMQQGILSALKQFMAADTKVPDTAAVNAGETRTPVMVLMSDGKPTAATNYYTQLDRAAIMGSNREDIRSANETDFLTQLTAAYAKAMMDAHYEEETPLLYTLSFGNSSSYTVMDPSGTLDKKNTAYESNPATVSGYWNKLIASNSMSLSYKVSKGQWNESTTNKTCKVSKTTVDGKAFPSSASQQYYVNKAFEAATADDLKDAFANIFTEISLQTHTYPTLVDGDENLDGYVSFVDRIGKYMSVTDVKGVLLGDLWFSGKELAKNFVKGGGDLGTYDAPTQLGNEMVWAVQKRLGIKDAATARSLIGNAYNTGQLSYNSKTGEYSNYIGWYADANGKYVSFWDGKDASKPKAGATFAVKSYGYLGELEEEYGVAASDMMYTTVQVRTNIKTGEEIVTFAVPAALIPLVEYEVDLDAKGNLKALNRTGADRPIRMVYEVALDDEVNEKTIYDPNVVDQEYAAANTDAEGYVNFYTNQYEADKSVGYNKVNTYSYFRPAHENQDYYYQENTIIYSNNSGTVYKNTAKPDANGKYYRAVKVYGKNGSNLNTTTVYKQIGAEVLATAVKNSDNTWYVPKGDVYVNVSDDDMIKTSNKTGTLENVNKSYVDIYGHNDNDTNHHFVVGDTLGNNGKVKMKPVAGIKLSKAIEGGVSADETFEFIIKADGVSGSYDTILVAKDGKESTASVEFKAGEAKVALKAGETLYISGVPAGDYKIRETDAEGYVVSSVKVNETVQNDKDAAVKVSPESLADVRFTNTPRGTGDLTIAKLVNHDLGVGYDIPDDVNAFEITVELDSIAIEDGDTFKIKRSAADKAETVKVQDGKIKFNIADKEQVQILALPEGTIATVREKAATGFTASYAINDEAVAGNENCIVEIKKAPYIDVVEVTNTYEPKPVSIKVDLEGTKSLKDGEGNVISDWKGAGFEFIIQKHVYENGKWQWVDTESKATVTDPGQTIDFKTDGKTLTFDKAGVYECQVIEKNHGLTIDGITYDDTMHTFNVVVTDAGMDGQLEAIVESSHGETNNFKLIGDVWTNDQINFTNIKNNGQTSQTVMIKKQLLNPSGSEAVSLEGYEFELYKSNEDFSQIGEKVTTTEKTNTAGEAYVQLGYEYDEIKDALKASENGTVTYHYVLKEKATGIAGMIDSKAQYNFSIKVSAVGGSNSGNITSEVITEGNNWGRFTSAGSTDAAPIVYPLASFTNTYDPTDAKISFDVDKKIDGRPLKADDFEFVLEAIEGAPLPAGASDKVTVTNDADGSVDFGQITFDKVGVFEYKIYEAPAAEGSGVTIDSNVYSAVVTVTDKRDEYGGFTGELTADVSILNTSADDITFKNTYKPAPTEITVEGTKKLTGLELISEQFSFTLTETDDKGVPVDGGKVLTARNDADGNFAFDSIKYDEPGTYYYEVTEDVPEQTHGIIYDNTAYMVKAVVTDNLKGQLEAEMSITAPDGKDKIEFINKYVPADATLSIPGYKVLEGKTLDADQFEFTLYESDETWNAKIAIESVKNDADGRFAFSDINYSCDTDKLTAGKDYVEKHYYIIKETNAGETIDGITYDDKSVGVVVTVRDDKMGHLIAEPEYFDLEPAEDGSGLLDATTAVEVRFDNVYAVTGEAAVEIEGTKTLKGRALKEGEFTFHLIDNEGEVLSTVQNGQDGTFGFEMTYFPEDVGAVYEYTIREAKGAAEGVKYDDAEYKVIVEVLDNGIGGIETEATVKKGLIPTDEVSFVNVYKDPSDGPLTGDHSNMIPFALVAIAALAGAVATIFRRREN